MSPFFKKSNPNTDQTLRYLESKIVNEHKNKPISGSLEDNIQLLKNIFEKDLDYSFRRFELFNQIPSAIIYFQSLVDKEKINQDIIKLLQEHRMVEENKDKIPQYIIENVLYYNDTTTVKDMSKIISAIMQGKAVVFIDGCLEALELDVLQLEKRSIDEPDTERAVRGPRDGFIEQLSINISLLRYRLPIPEFRVEETEVGVRTKTKVAVCYIEDIANPALVEEVKQRIDAIEIDGILDSGYIEQMIEDNPKSPFPQVINTERPTKVVGNLLEGRVAILMNGSPSALVV
ncbi:spore germination protein [Ureibacillus sp. FSL K6-8385]